jgi:hypothetical protein
VLGLDPVRSSRGVGTGISFVGDATRANSTHTRRFLTGGPVPRAPARPGDARRFCCCLAPAAAALCRELGSGRGCHTHVAGRERPRARPGRRPLPSRRGRRVAWRSGRGARRLLPLLGCAVCVCPHLFFSLSFFLLVTSRELRAGSACAMRMRRYSSVRRLQVFCATTTFCCALSFSTWSAAL